VSNQHGNFVCLFSFRTLLLSFSNEPSCVQSNRKKLKQNFALIISFKGWNILHCHALIEISYGGLTWPLHSLLHSTNAICETGIFGRVLGLPPHFIPASICAQYDPTHADGSSFLYQEQSRNLGAQVKLLFWYYYCHALITMPTESSTWVQEGTLIPERPKTYQVVKPIWQSSLLHTEITFLSQWYWQSSQRSPQLHLLWSLLKSETQCIQNLCLLNRSKDYMALATVHQSHNGWAHCCPLSTSLCNHTSSLESPRFTCLWYTAFKTNLGLQKKTVESNGLFQSPTSSSPQMSTKSWQWKPCSDQCQHQEEKTELQCKRYEALWRILTATPNPSHSCLDSKIPPSRKSHRQWRQKCYALESKD